MFVLNSYAWAVIFCIITMFCWGSWANTQKLAKKGWRFELFYWDYTIGVLLLTLVLGLTLGSNGTGGRPFLADFSHATDATTPSTYTFPYTSHAHHLVLDAAPPRGD